MPCRDYEHDDNRNYNNSAVEDSLRIQNDRLARIACKAMQELVDSGKADFLLIKDNEVREWWAKHQIADAAEAERKRQKAAKIRAAKAAKALKEAAKATALTKLSPEDREALGV